MREERARRVHTTTRKTKNGEEEDKRIKNLITLETRLDLKFLSDTLAKNPCLNRAWHLASTVKGDDSEEEEEEEEDFRASLSSLFSFLICLHRRARGK